MTEAGWRHPIAPTFHGRLLQRTGPVDEIAHKSLQRFYYPDEGGIKRKTILCRKITVEK
jgi:hypothetical protein